MRAIIDGDILCYEVGHGVEWGKEEYGLPHFDYVAEFLDTRIQQILTDVNSNLPPVIYLSGQNNFRHDIAVSKPYKGNRKDVVRPFHYLNIRAHLQGAYEAIVVDGIEADDAMAIHQMQSCEETIICSRDKDMRQIPGWHYSWELYNQPSWGPCYVCDPGWIDLVKKSTWVLEGTGLAWFYAQLLTGDRGDNIPGLNKIGPIKAHGILKGFYDEEDLYTRVLQQYYCHRGKQAEEYMLEQGQLLWIVREMQQDKPKIWELK